MAFQFPLAGVLRHRAMVEEREERLLQQITLELNQTLDHLEGTSRGILEAYASISNAGGRPLVAHEVQAAYGEVHALTETRKELEARIAKLEELRDKQRIVYAAARKEREVLSEMRQQARSTYDVELARREQRLLDDLHIARRGRS